MADDKKAEKPESTVKDGYQTIGEIAGFLLVLLMASGFLMQLNVPSFFSRNNEQSESAYTFPSPGNIQQGEKIYNKEVVEVRREPAGSILGTQEKAKHGTIIDGPISLYGTRWWKIDYPSAPDGWVGEESITAQMVLFFIKNFIPSTWGLLRTVAWWITILFAALIAFVMIKSYRLDKKDEEEEKFEKQNPSHNEPTPVSASAIVAAGSGPPVNLPTEDIIPNPVIDGRWTHILQLVQSFNENDWRQAIIEADIILEEMLDKMGYDGSTIGEKLKNVEESDFTTLDKAWEAHKVRNRIAHMGSNFKLSQQEAQRVISLYKEVFEEFYFI